MKTPVVTRPAHIHDEMICVSNSYRLAKDAARSTSTRNKRYGPGVDEIEAAASSGATIAPIT
jgi:hypothetical protein